MTEMTRKQEFLAVALDLFAENGYEATTVNEIIDRLQASKGGFYHYFKSKEEVLEAVAMQQIEAEIAVTQRTAADDRMPAAEKINRVLSEVLVSKARSLETRQKISRVFEHKGNAKLLRKIAEYKMQALHGPYLAIIEQGIREGVFATAYPEEAAEQAIQLMIILSSAVTRLASGAAGRIRADRDGLARRKIAAYLAAIERIWGARPGTINSTEVHAEFTDSL